MQPLRTYQRILTWICVCPDEITTKWQKLSHIAFTIVVFVSLIGDIVSSVFFVLKYRSTNLGDVLYAGAQIVGDSGTTYVFIALYFLRGKVDEVLKDLSQIYDACKLINSVANEFQFFLQIINTWTLILMHRWKQRFVSIFGESQWSKWTPLANLFEVCHGWIHD